MIYKVIEINNIKKCIYDNLSPRMSAKQISDILGTSYSTLNYTLKKHNIRFKDLESHVKFMYIKDLVDKWKRDEFHKVNKYYDFLDYILVNCNLFEFSEICVHREQCLFILYRLLRKHNTSLKRLLNEK